MFEKVGIIPIYTTLTEEGLQKKLFYDGTYHS
jgi:hypothetical protein